MQRQRLQPVNDCGGRRPCEGGCGAGDDHVPVCWRRDAGGQGGLCEGGEVAPMGPIRATSVQPKATSAVDNVTLRGPGDCWTSLSLKLKGLRVDDEHPYSVA
jgi:hypothetical protein